jgi:hypothetical protein
VHVGLGVEESVQGFSTSTGSVGIHSFVDLGHCVEQAPGGSWMELRVARSSPFTEHLWHLRRGDRSGVKGSYHDVVRTLIVDVRLVVSEDSIIEVS